MIGKLLQRVEDGRQLLEHLIEVALVALESARQFPKRAVRVDQLSLELGLVRGGEGKQAGAGGNVPAGRLSFVRHHLRDAAELAIERAELLFLARDLVA